MSRQPFRKLDDLRTYVEENRWVLLVHQSPELDLEHETLTQADWKLFTTQRKRDGKTLCYTLAGTEAGKVISPGLPPVGRSIQITKSLNDSFDRKLAEGDESLLRITNCPVSYAVVAIDIARFSDMKPHDQLLAANALAWVQDRLASNPSLQPKGRICTGDGYTHVFDDVHGACRFSVLTATALEHLNDRAAEIARLPMELHFRIGIHYGPLLRFRDWTEATDWNFIGSAVNDAHRVLAVIGNDLDDVVFVSDQARRHLPENLRSCLVPQGRRADKHGKWHRVFLLAHNQWLRENHDDRQSLQEAFVKETGINLDWEATGERHG